MRPEAFFDQLVSGVKVAFEIVRQQYERDDEAAGDVSEDNLKKREVRVIGETGNADDGQCAGFSSDN